MIFSQKFTTSWHDTDARRRVRPTQLLVYMQETSNAHLESMNCSLDMLRDEKKLAFILSKTRLEINAPLYAYENITVNTWTCESRGYAFSRFYQILRGEDIIATADTTWALISLKEKQLCRPESFPFEFEHEMPADMTLPSRFRVPKIEAMELVGERNIVYSDLDYNMHMNNTRYADMLCDFLPIDQVHNIKGMSLSYLHEAHFGDTVTVYGTHTEGKYLIRTVNSDGKACLEAEILM